MSLRSMLPSIILFIIVTTEVLSVTNNEPLLFETNEAKIVLPTCPLGTDSLQVIPKNDMTTFSDWQDAQHLAAYDLIRRIVKTWETQNITNYLIYGKETPETIDQFNWEVVPYSDSASSLWQQFSVLRNIIFGSTCLNEEAYKKDFQKKRQLFSTPIQTLTEEVKEVVHGNDVFCDQKVIQRQLVWEGKEVYVLYNYAPIVLSDEKLHFLIVPKQHREKFADLTSSEYLEAMQLAQQLVRYYQLKGIKIAYLFNKNGERAGQTVPHWHMHVVFAESKAQELLAKFTVLKNMIFGSSPMSSEELESKVKALREELEKIFAS